MSRPTVITGEMIAKIRELYELGLTKARIARELGLNEETVRRHATPEGEATVKAYQRARYERERTDPELIERRRTAAREYARRKRAEAKADPNRPPTKRELAAKLREAQGKKTRTYRKSPERGVERECCICGIKFRTIYRNTTCSPEHAEEWKKRYLKRYRAERAGDFSDGAGFLSMGPAGGGHRVGQQHGD